jgi:hypothetical protein
MTEAKVRRVDVDVTCKERPHCEYILSVMVESCGKLWSNKLEMNAKWIFIIGVINQAQSRRDDLEYCSAE